MRKQTNFSYVGVFCLLFLSCSKDDSNSEAQQVPFPRDVVTCWIGGSDGWDSRIPTGHDNTYDTSNTRAILNAEAVALRACWKASLQKLKPPENCRYNLNIFEPSVYITVADPAVSKVKSLCSRGKNISSIEREKKASEFRLPKVSESPRVTKVAPAGTQEFQCTAVLRSKFPFREKIIGSGRFDADLAMSGALNQCVKFIESENEKGEVQFLPSECAGIQCDVAASIQ